MIRDYRPDDLPAILEIHKQQAFGYDLPDLSSPLVLIHKVREVDGRVVAAMFLRVTAEAYLLCEGGSVAKGRAVEELQPEVDRQAFEKGLAEYISAIPPEIVEDFDPVLKRRGFQRVRDWPLYQRSLDAFSAESSG